MNQLVNVHRGLPQCTTAISTIFPLRSRLKSLRCSLRLASNSLLLCGRKRVGVTASSQCHSARAFHLLHIPWVKWPSRELSKINNKRPTARGMASLTGLNFDNLALRSVPIDPEEANHPRQVKGACFSRVKPTPVENPQLVAAALPALSLLGLDEEHLKDDDFVQYFAANKIFPGSETAAHCYCGHQFGYFAGQLGDGAAIYLGEIINERGERWELQLKGAGPTPYSRQADGRKVLRSSIREFLCSEAMHHLGIPSTRAATCVTSDSKVIRDIYYSGNPVEERCTVISRIAPTFIRFGSFQICKPPDRETGRDGPSVCMPEVLQKLTDYTISTFFPDIWSAHQEDKETAIVEFFKEVTLRTARLVAEWQCVGWCHGVLNTDNMSIVGLTIDYGPFGFIDRFDEDFICNTSDDGGRYSYKKQPEMCRWNCLKLAEALQQMAPMERLMPCLELFDEEFEKHYLLKMRKKLGLLNKAEDDDKELVKSFLETLQKSGADFTNCFRTLSRIRLSKSEEELSQNLEEVKANLLAQCCSIDELRLANRPRMDIRQLQMMLSLLEMNPGLLAQMGMAARGIMPELARLEKLKELKDKTAEWKAKEDDQVWSEWLEKYKTRLMKEVSGAEDVEAANQRRLDTMNSSNPKFILRNYIAQNAIEAAEKGDFSEVHRVLKVLQKPYSEDVDLEDLKPQPGAAATDDSPDTACASEGAKSSATLAYDARPPDWACDLRVT